MSDWWFLDAQGLVVQDDALSTLQQWLGHQAARAPVYRTTPDGTRLGYMPFTTGLAVVGGIVPALSDSRLAPSPVVYIAREYLGLYAALDALAVSSGGIIWPAASGLNFQRDPLADARSWRPTLRHREFTPDAWDFIEHDGRRAVTLLSRSDSIEHRIVSITAPPGDFEQRIDVPGDIVSARVDSTDGVLGAEFIGSRLELQSVAPSSSPWTIRVEVAFHAEVGSAHHEVLATGRGVVRIQSAVVDGAAVIEHRIRARRQLRPVIASSREFIGMPGEQVTFSPTGDTAILTRAQWDTDGFHYRLWLRAVKSAYIGDFVVGQPEIALGW